MAELHESIITPLSTIVWTKIWFFLSGVQSTSFVTFLFVCFYHTNLICIIIKLINLGLPTKNETCFSPLCLKKGSDIFWIFLLSLLFFFVIILNEIFKRVRYFRYISPIMNVNSYQDILVSRYLNVWNFLLRETKREIKSKRGRMTNGD